MTDQEINEAVADKIGFVRTVHSCMPDGCIEEPIEVPDYCHSIAAAWEIMEKVKTITLLPTEKGWHASSSDGRGTEGECIELWYPSNCMTRDEDGCLRCAIADTAPMAICLAFLKLGCQ